MKKVILAALMFVAFSAARASAATIDFTNVPEPTSMVLLGSGLLGLVARARRKKA